MDTASELAVAKDFRMMSWGIDAVGNTPYEALRRLDRQQDKRRE
jgi:hypothetical protein